MDCPLTYTLEFWNDDYQRYDAYTSEAYVQSWDTNDSGNSAATVTYADYSVTRGTGQLFLTSSGLHAAYDMDPWFNVTARLVVTSDYSVQDEYYVEDLFDISIVEKCRTVSLDTTMGVTGGGSGTFATPYAIDMW